MIPHPPITARYATSADKPDFVRKLFNDGAQHYDRIVDWGFLHSGARYRRWTQQRNGLRPGMHVLDVACGTGLVAVEAATILGSAEAITCLDPSESMLAIARTRLAARFVPGRAEALPFPENSFDFLTMGYALRHVASLEEAFGEFYRVLRPGGKVLILEVTKPPHRFGAFCFRLYFGRIYPFLTRMFTRSRDAEKMMAYFWETMDVCVPPDVVIAALKTAGFVNVDRRRQLGLFSEYTGIKS
jgi:demethylmenaquinone methyltransferase/2-methoxy-6-polyprenyl-1,4-benzoquinol methylase